jgi:hypothetical protein
MSDEKKCPVAASKSRFMLNLLMVALGAAGLYFLSIWASVAYIVLFFVFFFVIMPLKACQHCYYKVDATVEEWKEEHLRLHADCMKTWGSAIFLIWIVPIVGIVVSFFMNFSYVAVICLIGFVAILSYSSVHLRKYVCSHCAIVEVCPLRQPRSHHE